MASCAGVIRCIDESPHFNLLGDALHDVKRLLIGVGMGNSENLFLRIDDVIAHKGNQRIQRGTAAVALTVLHNMAVLIAAKNRAYA